MKTEIVQPTYSNIFCKQWVYERFCQKNTFKHCTVNEPYHAEERERKTIYLNFKTKNQFPMKSPPDIILSSPSPPYVQYTDK